jgi:peptidoglycan hydrolase CwlO-like protein
MLVERSRLLTAQEIQIATLESKVSALKNQIHDAGERIVEKDSHITELRLNVAHRDLQPGQGLTDSGETLNRKHKKHALTKFLDDQTRSLMRAREGEAIRSAQEVIRSLQKQLSKKDELVERYRRMIHDIRREVAEREEV